MKKIKILICSFLIFAGICGTYATESLENLLAGYLKNSLELKNLTNQMQKVFLENEKSEVARGFSFKLSSGTITFTTGDEWSVRFSPTANFSIPQARGLQIGVSSTLIFDSNDATEIFNNSSIKMSMNIISQDEINREINALKSERKILETKRSVQNGFVNEEKKFYQNLKSLYEKASKIYSLQKDLLENQQSLDLLKAQGYASSSTKYKSAQMSVLNSQHEMDSQKHSLERDVKIFCAQCGVKYEYNDPVDFLPTDIPSVEPISVDRFKPDDYTKLESAKWNKYINDLERNADSAISLTANAGFTFKNDKTKSSTVDLGTDFTWNKTGLVLSAGTNLPVGADSFNPVFTLGLSFDPNAIKSAKIDNQLTELEISQEDLEIQNAHIAFGTAIISQKSNLDNLVWEKSTCQDLYSTYTSVESDMARYYKQGYISLSEYRNAQANKENYRVKVLLNKLEMIIYNNDTVLLFVRDDELGDMDFTNGLDESNAPNNTTSEKNGMEEINVKK